MQVKPTRKENKMNNSGKFAFGAAIGLLIGSALAYFSDRKKRKAFVKGFNQTADKAKTGVVEGYYEAKEQYEKYRDMLKKKASEVGGTVSEFVGSTADKAKKALEKGAEEAKAAINRDDDKTSSNK